MTDATGLASPTRAVGAVTGTSAAPVSTSPSVGAVSPGAPDLAEGAGPGGRPPAEEGLAPDTSDRNRLAAYFAIARGFWKGSTRWWAWGLTVAVLGAVAAQITIQVLVNGWNRWFFDALERKDVAAVWMTIAWLPALVGAAAFVGTCVVVARMSLQAHWRRWMTDRFAGWWVKDQRYYRLGFTAPDQTAPEYRIADDVRLSVEPFVEFAMGLLTATVTAVTFAGILWSVGGSATLTLFGSTITVPAYLAIAALIYAAVSSGGAFLAGAPLVRHVAWKNETEAQFRAEMTRLRENAESIALVRGDADELAALRERYGLIFRAWLRVIRQNGMIAFVLNTNGTLFPIVPLLLATPKYLSGELSLGAVMQVTAAFMSVQAALNWFTDNFIKLADWFASVRRVDELTEALQDLDAGTVMEEEDQISLGISDDDRIHIENLSVAHKNGRVVIRDASVVIPPGRKVLIGGESGTGKSTLIRAIAGLWPWGSGSIRVPAERSIAFVPQKPYIPLGTLRDALLYPATPDAVSDEQIVAAMTRCGLGYLTRRLDEPMRWDQTLSGGERQRVAFARLLLQKPDIIVMDEATSALDEDSQSSLLQLLREDLVAATVVSVGHRPGLEEYHDEKITLERRDVGAKLTVKRIPAPFHVLFKRLMERAPAVETVANARAASAPVGAAPVTPSLDAAANRTGPGATGSPAASARPAAPAPSRRAS